MPPPVTNFCPPLSVIGILGGGQLGRMLAQAATRLGFKTHIYAPEADSPAFAVATYCSQADYHDEIALAQFAQNTDCITFEFENIPKQTVEFLAAHKFVAPHADALAVAQDRLSEKQFLAAHNICTAQWYPIDTFATLPDALARLDGHGILKTRRSGYDGKGQWRLDASEAHPSDLPHNDMILEEIIDFACEISVVLARGHDGQFVTYDASRNEHREHILHRAFVPSGIEASLEARAYDIAQHIAHALDYVGVLAVEFFIGRTGRIYVNEIAPRVHNSGHWTIDACCVSQFEQHIRAVAGWCLPLPHRHSDAEMTNLLGNDIDDWARHSVAADTALHIYGKQDVQAGRKMGHITRLIRR